MTVEARWYFDFVSPFAYLQWQRIKTFEGCAWDYRPILFAGLLNHFGHLGPAELANKRIFSYRHVQWRADRAGVAMCFPPTHPFNPLPSLRLCVAAGCTKASIDTVFNFIWRDGLAADTAEGIDALSRRLQITDVAAALASPGPRRTLQSNFQRAIEDDVFGVPSIVIDSNVFWGDDATDMFKDYLKDRMLFDSGAMQRLSNLPVGAVRKRP